MRRWTWLLLGLVGCASLTAPDRADLTAGRAGFATTCPAETAHRSYLRPEVVVVQCETRNGVIDGWKASFWPSGRRALFAEYRRGLPHGFISTWDEHGRKRAESHWVAGLRQGTAMEWHPSQRISYSVRYRGGLRDGVQLTYYANGQLRSRAKFRRGVQHGPVAGWYADGVKQVEGSYRDGRAEGLWSYWHTSGALDTRIHWRAGYQLPRTALLAGPRASGSRKVEVCHFPPLLALWPSLLISTCGVSPMDSRRHHRTAHKFRSVHSTMQACLVVAIGLLQLGKCLVDQSDLNSVACEQTSFRPVTYSKPRKISSVGPRDAAWIRANGSCPP